MKDANKILKAGIIVGLVALMWFIYSFEIDQNSSSKQTNVATRDQNLNITNKGLARVNALIDQTKPTLRPTVSPTVHVKQPPKKAPPVKPKPKLPKVEVFRINECETCDRLEEYLHANKLPYTLILVDTPAGRKHFDRYRFTKVPMIRLGNKSYVGNDPALLNVIFNQYSR
jgi:glutaredoxin